MSDDRIHILPGGHVETDDREPVPDVVEMATRLLEMAEDGRLRGLAYGAALDDGGVMYGGSYEPGSQWATHYAACKGAQVILDAGDEHAEDLQ